MSATTTSEPERIEAARKAASDPVWLFGELTKRIRLSRRSDCQLRITAHIREKTGHATIAAYHNNGATQQEKIAMYGECLKAVITDDFTTLKGTVPGGQAAAHKPVPVAPEVQQEPDPAIEKPKRLQEPAVKATVSEPPAVQPRVTAPVQQPAKAEILRQLAEMLEQSSKPAAIDAVQIEALVEKCVEKVIATRLACERKSVEAFVHSKVHAAKFELLKAMEKKFRAVCENVIAKVTEV